MIIPLLIIIAAGFSLYLLVKPPGSAFRNESIVIEKLPVSNITSKIYSHSKQTPIAARK